MTWDLMFGDLVALCSVIMIDLLLAGDNAIVIGMTASRVRPGLRAKVIAFGLAIAVLSRIIFAVFAVKLLAVVGLLLIGGLLLLWVSWKLWRDIHETGFGTDQSEGAAGMQAVAFVGFWSAIGQIAIADISMSLDNVLAVAGVGRHNLFIMSFGLLLSIALMGTAAGFICRLLERYRWLNYLGLLIVCGVALSMIYEGTRDVLTYAAKVAEKSVKPAKHSTMAVRSNAVPQ